MAVRGKALVITIAGVVAVLAVASVAWVFLCPSRSADLLQSEEVAAMRWIGLDGLKEELADHPNNYIAGFHQSLEVANMLYNKTHYKS